MNLATHMPDLIDDVYEQDLAYMETVCLMSRFLHEGRQDKHDAMKVFMDRVAGTPEGGRVVFITSYKPIEPKFGTA